MTRDLYHVVTWAGDHWEPLAIFPTFGEAKNWLRASTAKSSVFVVRSKQLPSLAAITGPQLLQIMRTSRADPLAVAFGEEP